jgi:ABC-type lipoprotein release transport system permease subunit
MNVIAQIALRNLVRQKRRNILLGIAIAFGMMILVLANAFSHGISDVIFNKILKYTSGHVSVNFSQNGNLFRMLFKDGDRMMAIVKDKVTDLSSVQEAIGIMSRAIGNGSNDNVIMVGMDPKEQGTKKDQEEAAENFKMIQGAFSDLGRTDVENPVLVAESKAKALNLKLNDVLRVRYQDVNSQNQAGRLTIVGIFKPANAFMSAPVFLNINDLKKLGGYGPHDIGQLYIMLKTDPRKNAKRVADTLHAALVPGLAAAAGTLSFAGKTTSALAVGYKNDSLKRGALADSLKSQAVLLGKKPFAKDGVALGADAAAVLGLHVGDTCVFSYRPKFEEQDFFEKLPVTEVLSQSGLTPGNIVLVNENRFYKFFYDHWPKPLDSASVAIAPRKGTALYTALTPEWLLLKRVKTTMEVQKQSKEMAKLRTSAFTVNVQSMYESASMLVNLEIALNFITLGAVMILFFIILIGVVNTLRMTIRERTREIGTVRAIGMQKNDVRNSFLYETFFLTLFSVAAGIIAAFAVMAGLSCIKMNSQDNPIGMLLVNGHLNFAPTLVGTISYTVLILIIAVVTAWFPAKRAANMSAAAALRHYE